MQTLAIILIVAGVAHYFWYTKIRPLPRWLYRILDRPKMGEISLARYWPEAGFVGTGVGVLLLFAVHFDWLRHL